MNLFPERRANSLYFRFIVSDSLRTELCLLYPPYLIAIAALYMTCVLHTSISSKLLEPQQSDTKNEPTTQSMSPSPTLSTKEPGEEIEYAPQLSSSVSPSASISARDEILNFLAGLNVSIEIIAYICQQILSTYSLWDSFTDHSEQDATRRGDRAESNKIAANTRGWDAPSDERVDLVTEREVVAIVLRMRQDRERNPPIAGPVGTNKMLQGFAPSPRVSPG